MPSTVIKWDDPETNEIHSFDITYAIERADRGSGIMRPHIGPVAISCSTMPGRAAQFVADHWDYFQDRILREEGLD